MDGEKHENLESPKTTLSPLSDEVTATMAMRFAAESYWRGPIAMPTIMMHMSRRKRIIHAGTCKTYEILQTALLHHPGKHLR